MRLWDRMRSSAHAFFSTATESSYTTNERVGGSTFQRMFDRGAEIMDAADEVAAEQRAMVVLTSRDEALCRWLLARLREQGLTPPFAGVAREGFFTLVEIPEQRPAAWPESEPDVWGAPAGPQAELLAEAADADLILYLFTQDGDQEPGFGDLDARAYSRLRTAGVPVLPVMLAHDQESPVTDAEQARLRQKLGLAPSVVRMGELAAGGGAVGLADGAHDSAADSTRMDVVAPADLVDLVNRMLALRPRLAIPLAQEAGFCRHLIAQRVIRTGALISGLVGAEPIPLLDLPLQVAVQWKVALQLAAIFGRPGLDVRSKEMVGAVGANILVRYAAQQLAKLIPVIGWLVSGLLSGASTWLLGNALLRYYENDRIWNWAATKDEWRTQADHAVAPVRAAGGAAVATVQRRSRGIVRRIGWAGRTAGAPAPDPAPEPGVQEIPIAQETTYAEEQPVDLVDSTVDSTLVAAGETASAAPTAER